MFNSKNSIIFASLVIILSIETFSFECNCNNSNKDETEPSKNSIKKIANTNDEEIESYLSAHIKPENKTNGYTKLLDSFKKKFKNPDLIKMVIKCCPTYKHLEALENSSDMAISILYSTNEIIEPNRLKLLAKIITKFENSGLGNTSAFLKKEYTNEQLEALSKINNNSNFITYFFMFYDGPLLLESTFKRLQILPEKIGNTIVKNNYGMLIQKIQDNNSVTDQEILDTFN